MRDRLEGAALVCYYVGLDLVTLPNYIAISMLQHEKRTTGRTPARHE